jgi:hypothetical protein
MRTLVVHPWVGEFGWELMSWQGYARKQAKKYDNVIVYGFEGREPLYTDFADVFIAHELLGDKDCWKLKKCSDPVEERELYAAVARIVKKHNADQLVPSRLIPLEEQLFIKYGKSSNLTKDERYDVLLHLRKRGRVPEHNVSEVLGATLVAKLSPMRVACIGSKLESISVKGADDLRGTPLERELDIIAGAGVVVGPSSGPMHLASLCGTPHVVWTDMRKWLAIGATNVDRYKKIWNPLGTRVEVIQTASPTVNRILDAITKAMQV